MKMNDFVANCLYMDGEVLDRYCDAFCLDICEKDVENVFSCCGDMRNFGKGMLMMIFDKIIAMYEDELDPDKFDWDVSSPSYPFLYYDEKVINKIEDLDAIVEQLENEKSK